MPARCGHSSPSLPGGAFDERRNAALNHNATARGDAGVPDAAREYTSNHVSHAAVRT